MSSKQDQSEITSAETSVEGISAQTSLAEVPTEGSAEVPTEASAEVSTEVPTEVPTEVSAGISPPLEKTKEPAAAPISQLDRSFVVDSDNHDLSKSYYGRAGESKTVCDDKGDVQEDLPLMGRSDVPVLRKDVISVAVHDGRFHADEVLGVALLKILYNNLGDCRLEVHRSRKNEILDKCDIVLDVGHVYWPENRRFDHHQESCNETFDDGSDILLSSAGMVWKEYGRAIVQTLTIPSMFPKLNEEQLQNMRDAAYYRIYHRVVKEIDANDNGQNSIYKQFDRPEIYRYHRHLNVGQTIACLNDPDGVYSDEQDSRFGIATRVMEDTVLIHMNDIFRKLEEEAVQIPLIQAAYDRSQESETPYMLYLPQGVSSNPRLISKIDTETILRFVVHHADNGNWNFSTRQVPGQRFVNCIDLLPKNQIEQVMDPQQDGSIVFVHKALFCGAATTRERAEEVCRLSYEANKENDRCFSSNSVTRIPSLLDTISHSAQAPAHNVVKYGFGLTGAAILGTGLYIWLRGD